METRIVLVTGGFDPLHSGHIEYFKEAKKLGNKLIVGLNSDKWLTRKKGKPFMSFDERKLIIENLSIVNDVMSFNDDDDSACDIIYKLIKKYHRITFANGGDRTKENCLEYDTYSRTPWVRFEFNVGGKKINSSKQLLEDWDSAKVNRDWGHWQVLRDNVTTKVKELTVYPGKKLSMQRHELRSEHWFVSEGIASVYKLDMASGLLKDRYKKHMSLHIPKGRWHMLANETNNLLKVIEIQYGEKCIEEDIERKDE
jgi:D-beta-D-heptose 7-phosphate kinase/D-beta-D-heptose 1-phosphate adenosyltransferase